MNRLTSLFRFAIVALFAATASAQFMPAPASPFNTLSPVAAVSADFDLDGIPDLAVAAGNGFVEMFLGQPGGVFGAAHQLISIGKSPSAIAVTDFNGDGLADLVVTNSGDNTATVLFGDGTGRFSDYNISPWPTGKAPAAVITGDFNRDGFQDFAVANMGDGTVSVLLGNGRGSFVAAAGSPFSVGSGPVAIAAGDLNSDSILDLAIANLNDNTVTVLLGSGTGAFTKAPGSPFATGGAPSALAVGDVNGDGYPDLAVANSLGNNLTILLGTANGSFSIAAGSPVSVGANPAAVALRDLNGDGHLDLAVANSANNTLSILTGNGAGGFSSFATLATGKFPNSIVTADLNGDHQPDLIVTNGITQTFSVFLNSQPALQATPRTISFNATAGQPNPQPVTLTLSIAAGQNTTYAVTSNQSWLSVSPASGNTNTPSPVAITAKSSVLAPGSYRGTVRVNAPGYYGAAIPVQLTVSAVSGTVSAVTNSSFPELDGPSIAVADFNGDGALDIAYVNDGLTNLVVMLGNGAGSFTPTAATPIKTGQLPRYLVAGDFKNDGKPGLAFANVNDQNIQVLSGDGKGNFFPAWSGFASAVGGLVTGDFNNDGNLDLLAIASNGIQLFLGRGDGTFSTPVSGFVPIGTQLGGIVAGDFNGDGSLDVAVTNNTNNNLTVLLGNGLGGFTALGAIPLSGKFPGQLAAADLNGDGVLDLAITTTFGSGAAVNILLGDGTGNFAPAQGSPVAFSGFAETIAAGDFNGDGKLDIAVTGSSLVVLIGDGTGAFTPKAFSQIATFGAYNLPVGDFNGDGRLDLFTETFGNVAEFMFGAVAPTSVTLSAKSAPNGQSVTLTAQVANTGTAFQTPTGNVIFYDGITPLTSVPLSGGMAITQPALSPGVHTAVAIYSGDAADIGSTSNTITVTILSSGNTQTITFPNPPEVSLGIAPFALTATVSSGLPVSFASDTASVCHVAGTTVTIIAVGTCTITASQPGNATYLPAPNVVDSFTVVAPPFGSFDTPANNALNNLAGAIGVTGWALSYIGVSNVAIYRNPLPGESPSGNGLVFIGNATFVTGARPDVAAAFPGYPGNNRGWGLQVLTNELPGVNGLPVGNGTYVLHAIATDADGVNTDLGAKTITVNNAGSTVPFGTIDTPTQGGLASGTIVNFGWALTPQPHMIPIDGSTITVYIDNVAQGHPDYNQPRADIQALFPGYKNTNGAVGFFYIDTTKLANGLHTIAWVVTDDAGQSTGIGSRFFMVQN